MLKLQVLEFVTRPNPVCLPPDLERALREGIERTESKWHEWPQRRWHEWEWNGFTVVAWPDAHTNIEIFTERFHVYATAKIRIVAPTFSSDDADAALRMFDWTCRPSPFIRRFQLDFIGTRDKVWAVYGKYVAFWQAWSVPVCDDVRRVIWRFLIDV